jgi:hypothetical protein
MNMVKELTPKKKIFLHIGHGKTGTSSIQSILANATADLEAANVLYPFAPGFEDAKKGFISSGNISSQNIDDGWLDYCVAQALQEQPDYKAYIFSSEFIFWHMDQFFLKFENYKEYCDFEIILTVRDPFDMFSSTYQQWVKRHGAVMSFMDFLVQQNFRECHATQALAILERLEELHDKVNVLNYTAVGRNIGSRVLGVMNVDDLAACHIAKNEIVNRSLDAAEFQLMLLINSVYGAEAGGKVSDALVNGLPSLPAMNFNFSNQSVARIKRNMQPFVDKINRRLPEGEKLSLQPKLCYEEAIRCHFLTSEQGAIAYEKLVEFFQESPASSGLYPDESMPVASLLLLMFLGSSSHSRIPISRQIYDIIVEECQASTCHAGICERFLHHHLLGYFDYFPAGASAFLSHFIPISQQLNALAHAGLGPSEVLDLFAIIHRVKLRVANG